MLLLGTCCLRAQAPTPSEGPVSTLALRPSPGPEPLDALPTTFPFAQGLVWAGLAVGFVLILWLRWRGRSASPLRSWQQLRSEWSQLQALAATRPLEALLRGEQLLRSGWALEQGSVVLALTTSELLEKLGSDPRRPSAEAFLHLLDECKFAHRLVRPDDATKALAGLAAWFEAIPGSEPTPPPASSFPSSQPS
ncbi:MAG TPA: hypothetical protein PKD86_07840 [Gemmatales bacterium]|nr:hypothetical protein [Gemmatales bacterium]HMP59249.1 hypothetical protein [Gemmatales bacterium]